MEGRSTIVVAWEIFRCLVARREAGTLGAVPVPERDDDYC
jgi:hypothetical protein